jgi:hypothetical protein
VPAQPQAHAAQLQAVPMGNTSPPLSPPPSPAGGQGCLVVQPAGQEAAAGRGRGGGQRDAAAPGGAQRLPGPA